MKSPIDHLVQRFRIDPDLARRAVRAAPRAIVAHIGDEAGLCSEMAVAVTPRDDLERNYLQSLRHQAFGENPPPDPMREARFSRTAARALDTLRRRLAKFPQLGAVRSAMPVGDLHEGGTATLRVEAESGLYYLKYYPAAQESLIDMLLSDVPKGLLSAP